MIDLTEIGAKEENSGGKESEEGRKVHRGSELLVKFDAPELSEELEEVTSKGVQYMDVKVPVIEGVPEFPLSSMLQHEIGILSDLDQVVFTDRISGNTWYHLGQIRTKVGMRENKNPDKFHALCFITHEIACLKDNDGKITSLMLTVPQTFRPERRHPLDYKEGDSWARAGFLGGVRKQIGRLVLWALKNHTDESKKVCDFVTFKDGTNWYNTRDYVRLSNSRRSNARKILRFSDMG